ncbi:methyl-accepting chemotaxis protein [Vibrio sp. VNB-15]
MQLSLKNLSVRTQILVPVLFTAITLFIALWITQNNLEAEQELVASNSESLVFYKDTLAQIDDQVYPLRISAVYAIYDASRRDAFLADLKAGAKAIDADLDLVDARGTFSKEAQKVRQSIDAYIDYSTRAVEFFNRHDRGLVSDSEYTNFISGYRHVGNEMVATINALSQRVNEIATSADATAREADGLAQSGLAIFQESAQASEQMSQSLNDAAQVVLRLKEQSVQINDVIEVIRGVSEQTNLLALNAAIEAARAGESGRGFAVVADEVRMLAARTQDSTQEISSIIEELQAQSGLANDSMQVSLEMLNRNNELTQQANDALIGITESVANINDSNTQVATAAEEQSQVTQDINRNVVNMSELVNQNVAGISQSASASTELSHLAEKQKEQLSFFKL